METIFVGMNKSENYIFMEIDIQNFTYREFVCKIQKIEDDKLIEILDNLTKEERLDILEKFNLKPSEIGYGLVVSYDILKKHFDYNQNIGIVEAIGDCYCFTEIEDEVSVKNYLDINCYQFLKKEIDNKTIRHYDLGNCTKIEEVLEDILCKTLFFENDIDIDRELIEIMGEFGIDGGYEQIEQLFEDLKISENNYSIITGDNYISVACFYQKNFYHKVFRD